MLPHHLFWLETPSLIRDGYFFFISPCLSNRAEYQYYQRVPGADFDNNAAASNHHEDNEDTEDEVVN